MTALGIDLERHDQLRRIDPTFEAWRRRLLPCPLVYDALELRALDEGLQRWHVLALVRRPGHARGPAVQVRGVVTPPARPHWLRPLEDHG